MEEKLTHIPPSGFDGNLVIDIGTQSVRVALVSFQHQLLRIESAPISINRIDSDKVEQDGAEILSTLNRLLECFNSDTYRIRQVGLAIQRSTVIAWSKTSGEPLLPALSWQDTRNKAQVKQLINHEELIQGISGLKLSPHYGASKLAFLHKTLSGRRASNEDTLIAPLVSFVLYSLLEGSPFLCDETNAARTQLFDINNRCWNLELTKLFNVGIGSLPKTFPSSSNVPPSSFGFVKALTSSSNTCSKVPLTVVCGDQSASYNALKQLAKFQKLDPKNCVYINLGSGAFVLSENQGRSSNKLLTTLISSNSEKLNFALEGTINGAGVILEECFQRWSSSFKAVKCEENIKSDQAEFYNLLDNALTNYLKPNFPVSLMFLNTLGGSPYWFTDIKSRWLDYKKLSLHANDKNFTNVLSEENKQQDSRFSEIEKSVAVVESIVFLIQLNVEEMVNVRSKFTHIVVAGGCSRLNGLCQMLANLSKLNVIRSGVHEATLIGVSAMFDNEVFDNEVFEEADEGNIDEFNPCLSAHPNKELNLRFELFKQSMQDLDR